MSSRITTNPIIHAVRKSLEQSDRALVELPTLDRRDSSTLDGVQSFIKNATLVGTHCTVAHDLSAAKTCLASLCRSLNLRNVARSDGPLVATLLDAPFDAAAINPIFEDPTILFGADAGITEAQWGIAETGTLVLESGSERHRLTSLIPPIHIAVLPTSRILPTMSVALDRLALTGKPGPADRHDRNTHVQHRAVTFVTGPSRTADIELTLVVGVHGPKELHIIVLRDDNKPPL